MTYEQAKKYPMVDINVFGIDIEFYYDNVQAEARGYTFDTIGAYHAGEDIYELLSGDALARIHDELLEHFRGLRDL